MAADLGRFVWRADAKQEGLFYTARALKERQGGSQWRKKKTKKFQHALLAEEKNVAKPELASSSALEAEIKRRCQPGFFVPCRYLLPCQQYMELYQRRAKEEREQPHTDDRRCRCRDTVPVATGGCKSDKPRRECSRCLDKPVWRCRPPSVDLRLFRTTPYVSDASRVSRVCAGAFSGDFNGRSALGQPVLEKLRLHAQKPGRGRSMHSGSDSPRRQVTSVTPFLSGDYGALGAASASSRKRSNSTLAALHPARPVEAAASVCLWCQFPLCRRHFAYYFFRGHPLEMFGVWEYGDCSVCNPHSARFGDDHATHDTVLPGQGSLDRDRAEDGQASTSGTGLSDISWGESFRHPEALARAGAQMEQAESWAGYPRGRYQINVEKPEGSEDDLETFDYDISPKSPSSASIFVDDDTSSHTPRRHRLFTGETADVTNVSGTVGSSGRWRASPAANSRYTGEFGATSSRYGDLSGVEKYTANMQQADFDRFFSLILSCRRLEKNIESQNLQLELYEKGYGQKVIEEVLRTPAVSSGTTAKNEPARKPATQEGRRTILGKCQPPRETALGSKSPANSFRIGAKQAGAPVARQGLQTPQVP